MYFQIGFLLVRRDDLLVLSTGTHSGIYIYNQISF